MLLYLGWPESKFFEFGVIVDDDDDEKIPRKFFHEREDSSAPATTYEAIEIALCPTYYKAISMS